MCLLASLVRPSAHGRPEIPTENGPDILYPDLKRPRLEQPPVADEARVHQAGLDVVSPLLRNPEAQKFLEDPGNYKFPRWLMGPQPTMPQVPLPRRMGAVPTFKSPLAPPAPPPSSQFSPLPIKDTIPKSLGGSPPPRFEPPAPTPADPPKLPESKGLVPPDLKDIIRPIPGGTQTIPPGGFIQLPDSPPQLDMPLVLLMDVLTGEKKNDGEVTVSYVDDDDLAKAIPEYKSIRDLVREAAVLVPGKGNVRGMKVHRLAEARAQKELAGKGKKVWIEYTLGDEPYSTKGVPRVDIYVDKGDEIRIYQIKTRTAREKEYDTRWVLNHPNLRKAKRIIVMEVWGL